MEENFAGVKVFSSVVSRYQHRIYLSGLDGSPVDHAEAVETIRGMSEEDTAEIFLSTPGGDINISEVYLSAISETLGTVITHAVGEVASAGVDIFLGGHERVCHENCFFMFHNVQMGGDVADMAIIHKRAKFYDKLFKESSYEVYREVLTEEEIAELFDRAGEVYLTCNEMRERLAKAGDFPKVAKDGEPINKIPEVPAKLISLPFMKTHLKKAEEFFSEEVADNFKITLDSGYEKEFCLSTLRAQDFSEYCTKEIQEIADSFGITGTEGLFYPESAEVLVTALKAGVR